MMPEMDGFEFVAALRRRDEWRAIPIIVVTAKDLAAEERRAPPPPPPRPSCKRALYDREALLAEICTTASPPGPTPPAPPPPSADHPAKPSRLIRSWRQANRPATSARYAARRARALEPHTRSRSPWPSRRACSTWTPAPSRPIPTTCAATGRSDLDALAASIRATASSSRSASPPSGQLPIVYGNRRRGA